ncbi:MULTISPECIES: DUF6766 family protein [unclassified Streptomyces]|uniref:DUF6766 family protein n=1 Tax=unclassified Streptomyces TaxID=2593676 RepID=UPI0031BA6B33
MPACGIASGHSRPHSAAADRRAPVPQAGTRPGSCGAAAGGWRQGLYSNSLGLVMGTILIPSWLAQSIAGTSANNAQRLRQLQAPISWGQYTTSADFWSRTLQNWQSELLAVASMAILSIYLRQRGSPESKPVGTPHDTTGIEG